MNVVVTIKRYNSLLQVVTLSVHVFFGACLLGRQYVDNDDDEPDLYIPVFTILQFFFYMGWLKVSSVLYSRGSKGYFTMAK